MLSVASMPPSPDRAQDLIESLRAAGSSDDGRSAPRLLTLPAGLRDARLRVKASAVWGAALLVVLVLVVLGVRVAWAERVAQPELVRPADGAATSANPLADDSPPSGAEDPAAPTQNASATGTTPPAAETLVHVIGAVREPGVVSVPAGARVSDAVQAAGGVSDEAELSRLNLARVVLDGERIWVPVTGADPPSEVSNPGSTPASAGPSDPGAASSPGLVDINTADTTGLEALPGVGPVTAAAILAWRDEHGAFSTVEELLEVSGIGPRTLENVRDMVVVGP
ncbi:hypothetical protein BH23ACT6_BH23ACT6_07880 [soil metagenome]